MVAVIAVPVSIGRWELVPVEFGNREREVPDPEPQADEPVIVE